MKNEKSHKSGKKGLASEIRRNRLRYQVDHCFSEAEGEERRMANDLEKS